MEIQQFNSESKGFFKAVENEAEAGKMFYSWAGEKMLIIDHTDVNPEFGGRGVGKLLLMKLVEFTRENNIKVIPLCPFAKSVFDKTPDIHDVLKKN